MRKVGTSNGRWEESLVFGLRLMEGIPTWAPHFSQLLLWEGLVGSEAEPGCCECGERPVQKSSLALDPWCSEPSGAELPEPGRGDSLPCLWPLELSTHPEALLMKRVQGRQAALMWPSVGEGTSPLQEQAAGPRHLLPKMFLEMFLLCEN